MAETGIDGKGPHTRVNGNINRDSDIPVLVVELWQDLGSSLIGSTTCRWRVQKVTILHCMHRTLNTEYRIHILYQL